MEVEVYVLNPPALMIGFAYHDECIRQRRLEFFLGVIAIDLIWEG